MAAFLALSGAAVPVSAQVVLPPGPIVGPLGPLMGRSGGYPSNQYYLALEIYRSGDLAMAVEAFDAALGQGRLDAGGRWVDSIPPLAMLAECYWELGNIPAAMSNIDAVTKLTIDNRGWLSRVNFNDALQDAVRVPESDSGWAGTSNLRLAPVARRISIQRGEAITEQRIARGGAIEPLSVVPLDVAEVMRCIAVSLHRRRIILGELSKEPPVPAEVLEATKYPQGMNVPIGQTLIGALRAVGRYADLDHQRVLEEAAKSATLAGAIHPLTPIVLLCQAETLAASERPSDAVPVAIKSAQAAAALGQPEWVDDALQLALGCSEPATFAQIRSLATGAAGSYQRSARAATLGSLIVASEASVLTSEPEAANALLQQAQTITSRRGFSNPRLAAYGAYVRTLLAISQGATLEGNRSKPTATPMAFIKDFNLNQRVRNVAVASNPSIFQMNVLVGGTGFSASGVQTQKLLRYYSDEPPAAMWRRDPVEALGWLMFDRSLAARSLLIAAADTQDSKKVMVDADLLRRVAFRSQLTLGGRLQNIRTLASVSPDRVDKEAKQFLAKPPTIISQLRQAAQQAGAGDVINPDLATSLESKAAMAAIARASYPDVLLPKYEAESHGDIRDRTGVLTFTAVGNVIVATLASKEGVTSWAVGDAVKLSTSIGQLLSEMGIGTARASKLRSDGSWRATAANLRRQVLAESAFDRAKFDELIVIPTGTLWYLPIEALPEGGEDSPFIGEQLRVRYSPTPGLAIYRAPLTPKRFDGTAEVGTTAIASGPFFAPRDVTLNGDGVKKLVEASGESITLPAQPAVPTGWLSPNIRRLVIAAPRAIDPANSLAFAPADYEANVYEGTIAGWLALPNQSPTSVLLPGLRTPAAAGRLGDGSELFMLLTSMQISGVRDCLISRWAVGGPSTLLLLAEFLQELPHLGPDAAWERALLLLRDAELNPEREPLILSPERDAPPISGSEPLFWAGYMLAT